MVNRYDDPKAYGQREEECLIRAERAWESGREAEIRETGEALVKLRRALRTLADVERSCTGAQGLAGAGWSVGRIG